MKSLSSIGKIIAKQSIFGLKGSTLVILSGIAISGAVVVNEIYTTNKESTSKKNTPKLTKKIKPLEYQDLIFSSALSNIFTNNYTEVKENIINKKSVVNKTNPLISYKTEENQSEKQALQFVPDFQDEYYYEPTLILTLSDQSNSEHQFSKEDHAYFDNFGLERMITPASYQGGSEMLEKFIEDELKYPVSAKDKEIEGTVTVNFLVDSDGSISDVQIKDGVSPELDKEALRLVSSFPYWLPKEVNFVCVKSNIELPVKFDLQ